jgi:dCTP deaminase
VSIRPDTWIARMAKDHGLISPFEPQQVREVNGKRVVSYGLSSFGYDIRVADEFRVFTNVHSNIVDPKAFDARGLVEFKGAHCDIPPNSFALGLTLETFRIPRNVLTLCVGKSTYARCGIIVNVTPFEPGWEGRAVLEISNSTPLPARIYAFEGIAQVIFFECAEPCATSYAERHGKYQGQQQITFPRV